jgi:hypothetical protein
MSDEQRGQSHRRLHDVGRSYITRHHVCRLQA